jgi:hypothetical protein
LKDSHLELGTWDELGTTIGGHDGAAEPNKQHDAN